MARYFSIPQLKEAIEHLQEFDSKRVLVPLVFAVNGVDDSKETNLQEKGGAADRSTF